MSTFQTVDTFNNLNEAFDNAKIALEHNLGNPTNAENSSNVEDGNIATYIEDFMYNGKIYRAKIVICGVEEHTDKEYKIFA